MTFKLLEHYTSVQGEGPKVGTLTQFVRFAGCNLRCPGWPCDTPQAIFPNLYVNQYEKLYPGELVARCEGMRDLHGATNICLTGGEPLMQDATDIRTLCKNLRGEGFSIEIFSNGSYPFAEWVRRNCTIMMDWKLTGSGEKFTETMHSVRLANAGDLTSSDGIKFVCKNTDDLFEALNMACDLTTKHLCRAKYWLGVAFGELTEADAVQFMMDHQLSDWGLNVQVHKYVWNPNARFV